MAAIKRPSFADLIAHNPLGIAWGQRGKTTIPYRKSESGMPECRWCGVELKQRWRAWCGDLCRSAGYLRMNWACLRKEVSRRDQNCVFCSTDGRLSNCEVDHIVAVIDGGTDDPKNLRLLCVPCHKTVTIAQARARSDRRKSA
jgi:5-methylcytosine-specific restriction endonuclease McrA